MIKECRIWLLIPIFLFLTHTHTHTHTNNTNTQWILHTHALETASSVEKPFVLSPAQHTAHDRRPPAPPEQTHCARSLSHWSQFSACGQSHIAHIVAASSPIRLGGEVCSGGGYGRRFGGEGVHHMRRSYHSLRKQARHLLVPVKTEHPAFFFSP